MISSLELRLDRTLVGIGWLVCGIIANGEWRQKAFTEIPMWSLGGFA